jgi:hypothetical protein
VAKKTARKTASPPTRTPAARNTPPATPGARRSKFVDIKELRTMLTELKSELLDDETDNGPSRKSTSAILRINDLLPLLEHCQQSMTRP